MVPIWPLHRHQVSLLWMPMIFPRFLPVSVKGFPQLIHNLVNFSCLKPGGTSIFALEDAAFFSIGISHTIVRFVG